MSKFIVTLDVGTLAQRNAVTEHFQRKGWNCWHWMEDTWLLATLPRNITAQTITDELEMVPVIAKKRKMVIGIDDDAAMTYWGHAPQDAWQWMKTYWGKQAA